MARETIDRSEGSDRRSRDREIARLQGMVAELREDRAATNSALRIMRALIDDVSGK
jgi:hypothetical protein